MQKIDKFRIKGTKGWFKTLPEAQYQANHTHPKQDIEIELQGYGVIAVRKYHIIKTEEELKAFSRKSYDEDIITFGCYGKPRFTKAWLFRDEIDTELERFVEEEEYDEVYYHVLWNPEKAEIELTEEYKQELLEDIKKLKYIKYLDEDYNFQGLCDTVIENLWNGLERDEIRFEVYSLQYAPDRNDDTHNTNTLEEMLDYIKEYNVDLVEDEAVVAKILIDGNGHVLELLKTYDASELAERE